MGTRALTFVLLRDKTPLVCIYRQFDGYPEQHGKELFQILKDVKLINGISSEEPPNYANGIECLAAQIVWKLKEKHPLGNIYIYPTDAKDCGEDYTYTVYEKDGCIALKVESGSILYDGPITDFNPEEIN